MLCLIRLSTLSISPNAFIFICELMPSFSIFLPFLLSMSFGEDSGRAAERIDNRYQQLMDASEKQVRVWLIIVTV